MTIDERLLAIAREQNKLIDDGVSQLRERLTALLERAVPRAQAEMSARLSITDGIITATRANREALYGIRSIMEDAMWHEGLQALLDEWTGTFPGQLPLLRETLATVGIRMPRQSRADRLWIETAQVSAQEQVADVVRAAARAAQQRILMNYGAVPLRDLFGQFHRVVESAPQAATLADTSATIFVRSIAKRSYESIDTHGDMRFRLYGPDDKLTRPFCDAALAGRKLDQQVSKNSERRVIVPHSADATYTRAEIAEMSNGQLDDPMTTAGGYRCRHQWIVAIPRES